MKSEMEYFLDNIIDIGKKMILNGAEISRVEDTLTRIIDAYPDYIHAEVYASTTLIVCTIDHVDGNSSTRSARVCTSSNDLQAIEDLNTLSRYICENRPSTSEIKERLNCSPHETHASLYRCLGYFLCASSCSIFIGGTLMDGMLSGLIAILLFCIDYFTRINDINHLIYTLLMNFLTACLAVLSVHFGIATHVDKIIIGDIMLFIPALALVNGIKDMIMRNITSGVFRVVEAILLTCAIALGNGCALKLLGGLLV